MNVIIDTNVLVSGIFFKGTPFNLLVAWKKGKFKLIITHEILDEYKRVIEDLSKNFPNIQVAGIIEKIALNSVLTFSVNLPEPICTDPDDDKFFAAAIASKTKIIISGDKHLLSKSGHSGVKVLKPSEFYDTYISLNK